MMLEKDTPTLHIAFILYGPTVAPSTAEDAKPTEPAIVLDVGLTRKMRKIYDGYPKK